MKEEEEEGELIFKQQVTLILIGSWKVLDVTRLVVGSMM